MRLCSCCLSLSPWKATGLFRAGKSSRWCVTLQNGVVPKELLTFLGFFLFIYAMRSLVPSGHFRNISGHYSLGLFAGLLNDAMGYCLLVVSCEMTRTKWLVLKGSHWIHLGWWSTGSPKLQLFQLSQHSHVTNCRLVSSSAYFPWNITSKYSMQLSEGSWDKILHSKSKKQCFSQEDFFFLAVCLSKRYTKARN